MIRKVGERGQKLQTSSYEIYKSSGVVFSAVTLVNCIVYLEVAERLDVKNCLCRKKESVW